MISEPIRARPGCLKTLVVGAATYPAFEAMDSLIGAGVSVDRLCVHLGHTKEAAGKKNPFVRFHPMLHSKIYFMELGGGRACAFIGSNNATAFALGGLNGEAAVLLEGESALPEFATIRAHIEEAQSQAVQYSPGFKEAFTWWMREFIDGLKAEIRIPQDWTTIRTLLLFASAPPEGRPVAGDQIYFEIPAGIEQIDSLKTETHLFLFDTLPADPWQALMAAPEAPARFNCKTIGAENLQGNRELKADWRVEDIPRPTLSRVHAGFLRPTTGRGKQQIRAEVVNEGVTPFEYLFDREREGWDPQFAPQGTESIPSHEAIKDQVALAEAVGPGRSEGAWKLVRALSRRKGPAWEKDQAALLLAAPDSGSFVLVSLRRRRKDSTRKDEEL